MGTKPAFFTVPELAAYLRLSTQSVYFYLQTGRIKGAKKLGKHWLIPYTAVEKLTGQAIVLGICLLLAWPVQAAPRRGMASWYSYASTRREGNSGVMANGERMHDEAFTAANWDYRFGTRLRVTTTTRPSKSVVVEVTDRGPARHLCRTGRILDLSPAAFRALAPLSQGVLPVEIEVVSQP